MEDEAHIRDTGRVRELYWGRQHDWRYNFAADGFTLAPIKLGSSSETRRMQVGMCGNHSTNEQYRDIVGDDSDKAAAY